MNFRSARATASLSLRAPTKRGNRFDGRCELVVSGITPPARFWTLSLYDMDGRLVANALGRHGFTSQEIVRGAEGNFDITISPRSRPGNWLPTGGVERYMLVLRLYDTPVGVATRAGRETKHAFGGQAGVSMMRLLLWIVAGVLARWDRAPGEACC